MSTEVDISAGRCQGLASCFPKLQPFCSGIPLPLCLPSQCFPLGCQSSLAWLPTSPTLCSLPFL